jgi:hypothetical protein
VLFQAARGSDQKRGDFVEIRILKRKVIRSSSQKPGCL